MFRCWSAPWARHLAPAVPFVAGSEELIESLIQFTRPYIYTTSQPPAPAVPTLKSLELLCTEHWRREHLKQLISQFRRGAEQIGLQLMDSFTPIQPIMIGDSGGRFACHRCCAHAD